VGVLDDSRFFVVESSSVRYAERAVQIAIQPVDPFAEDGDWTLVNVPLKRQERSRWCWAAVATSVDAAYGRKPSPQQCHLASAVLRRSCCSGGCNTDYWLDRALEQVQRYDRKVARPLDANELRSELAANRPVTLLVTWRGGGGHFVIVTGIRGEPTSAEVEVADPDGKIVRRISLSRLRASYRDLGQWRVTYYTKP